MTEESKTLLQTVSKELQVPEAELLRQGLKAFLERELLMVKADIYAICVRYGVVSVEEMESRYRNGSLEESNTWQDLQRLDHLEYKRDHLLQLIETAS